MEETREWRHATPSSGLGILCPTRTEAPDTYILTAM